MTKIDEEFKALIPSLTDEEFKQLEQNIVNDGLRDPIITWNEIIIDGHNRHEICKKNSIALRFIEKKFESRKQVIEWMIMNQFGRRNLSNYQRSLLALKLKPFFEEKAKKNLKLSGEQFGKGCPDLGNPIEKVHVDKEISKIADVGKSTIAMVQKIEKEASPEIKEKLRNKEMSINAAYKEVTVKKVEEVVETVEETSTCLMCGKTLSIDIFEKGSKTRCKPCGNYIKNENHKGNKVDVEALKGEQVDFEKLLNEMKKGHPPTETSPSNQRSPIITQLVDDLKSFHVNINRFTYMKTLNEFKNELDLVNAINKAYEDIKKIKNNMEESK